MLGNLAASLEDSCSLEVGSWWDNGTNYQLPFHNF